MKGKGKVPCTPINNQNTLASNGKQLGSVKNDSVSSLSIEKKSVKI